MRDSDYQNDETPETDAEQEAPAKAPKGHAEPTTAKHARFLLAAAERRIEKQREAVGATLDLINKYTELAATLPESGPDSPGKDRPVYGVGDVVTFRFGRTTPTSQAKVLAGVVKARKDDENGKPEAYRIAVGTGFDEELRTVFPGAILAAGESIAENEAADEKPGDNVTGL